MKCRIFKEELEKIVKDYYMKEYGSDCTVSFVFDYDDREQEEIFECEVIRKIGDYQCTENIEYDEFTKIVAKMLKLDYDNLHFINFGRGLIIEEERKNMKKRLNEVKEMLVVIDMVNGFVKEGALAAPSIMRVVPRQQQLLFEQAGKMNTLNVFVRDEHDDESIEFNTFGPHCIKGSGEELLIEELEPYHKDAYDFTKNSTNFMMAPGVIPFFEKCVKLEKVAFIGCLSEVCVKNAAITARNYFDQVNRNVEVGVYADAIDTFDAPGHDALEVTERALTDMEANGVKIYRK